MRRLAIALACVATTACTQPDAEPETEAAAAPAGPTQVALETNLGRIVIDLETERSPETVNNFLRHVRSGFYDGIIFHRVEENFVAQAGVVTEDRGRRTSSVMGVFNEAGNGLKNAYGTVAMARTSDPHSATSEFFFNLKDNTALDFTEETLTGWGYAVFGTISEGLEVMDSIGSTPTQSSGRYPNMPVEPIVIQRAFVVGEGGN